MVIVINQFFSRWRKGLYWFRRWCGWEEPMHQSKVGWNLVSLHTSAPVAPVMTVRCMMGIKIKFMLSSGWWASRIIPELQFQCNSCSCGCIYEEQHLNEHVWQCTIHLQEETKSRGKLIAVSSPATVGQVPGPAAIWNDRRACGSETPAGGAVIGQLKHVTPQHGGKVKGHHWCDLSIMQMLNNSLNYHNH